MNRKRSKITGFLLLAMLISCSASAYDDTGKASERMALQTPSATGRHDDFALQYYLSKPRSQDNAILDKFITDGQAIENLIFNNTLTAKAIDLKVNRLQSSMALIREMDSDRYYSGKEFYALKNIYIRLFDLLPKGHPFKPIDLQVPDRKISISGAENAALSEIGIMKKAARLGDTKTLREHLNEDPAEITDTISGLKEQITFYRTRSKDIINEIIKLRTYIAEIGVEALPERIRVMGDTANTNPLKDAKDRDDEISNGSGSAKDNLNALAEDPSQGSALIKKKLSAETADKPDHNGVSQIGAGANLTASSSNVTDISISAELSSSDAPSPESLLKTFQGYTLNDINARILSLSSDIAILSAKSIELSAANELLSSRLDAYKSLFKDLPAGFGIDPLNIDGNPLNNDANKLQAEYDRILKASQKDLDQLSDYLHTTAGRIAAIMKNPSIDPSTVDELIKNADQYIAAYMTLTDKASSALDEIQTALMANAPAKIQSYRSYINTLKAASSAITGKKSEFDAAYQGYQGLYNQFQRYCNITPPGLDWPIPTAEDMYARMSETIGSELTSSQVAIAAIDSAMKQDPPDYSAIANYLDVDVPSEFAYGELTDNYNSLIGLVNSKLSEAKGIITTAVNDKIDHIQSNIDNITEKQNSLKSKADELSSTSAEYNRLLGIIGTENINTDKDRSLSILINSHTWRGPGPGDWLSPEEINSALDRQNYFTAQDVKDIVAYFKAYDPSSSEFYSYNSNYDPYAVTRYYAYGTSSYGKHNDGIAYKFIEKMRALTKTADKPIGSVNDTQITEAVVNMLTTYNLGFYNLGHRYAWGSSSWAISMESFNFYGVDIQNIARSNDSYWGGTISGMDFRGDYNFGKSMLEGLYLYHNIVPDEYQSGPLPDQGYAPTQKELSALASLYINASNLSLSEKNALFAAINSPSPDYGKIASLMADQITDPSQYDAELNRLIADYNLAIDAINRKISEITGPVIQKANEKISAYNSCVQSLTDTANAIDNKKSEFDSAYQAYIAMYSAMQAQSIVAITPPGLDWPIPAAEEMYAGISQTISDKLQLSQDAIAKLNEAMGKNPPDYADIVGRLNNVIPGEVEYSGLTDSYNSLIGLINNKMSEAREAIKSGVDNKLIQIQKNIDAMAVDKNKLLDKADQFSAAYANYKAASEALGLSVTGLPTGNRIQTIPISTSNTNRSLSDLIAGATWRGPGPGAWLSPEQIMNAIDMQDNYTAQDVKNIVAYFKVYDPSYSEFYSYGGKYDPYASTRYNAYAGDNYSSSKKSGIANKFIEKLRAISETQNRPEGSINNTQITEAVLDILTTYHLGFYNLGHRYAWAYSGWAYSMEGFDFEGVDIRSIMSKNNSLYGVMAGINFTDGLNFDSSMLAGISLYHCIVPDISVSGLPTAAELQAAATLYNTAINLSEAQRNALSTAINSAPPDYGKIASLLNVTINEATQYSSSIDKMLQGYDSAIISITHRMTEINSLVIQRAGEKIQSYDADKERLDAFIGEVNNKKSELDVACVNYQNVLSGISLPATYVELSPEQHQASVLAFLADNFVISPADISGAPSEQELAGLPEFIRSAQASIQAEVDAINYDLGKNPPDYTAIIEHLNASLSWQNQMDAFIAKYSSVIDAINGKISEIQNKPAEIVNLKIQEYNAYNERLNTLMSDRAAKETEFNSAYQAYADIYASVPQGNGITPVDLAGLPSGEEVSNLSNIISQTQTSIQDEITLLNNAAGQTPPDYITIAGHMNSIATGQAQIEDMISRYDAAISAVGNKITEINTALLNNPADHIKGTGQDGHWETAPGSYDITQNGYWPDNVSHTVTCEPNQQYWVESFNGVRYIYAGEETSNRQSADVLRGAIALAQPGDVILVRSGTYGINDGSIVEVKDGVTMIGGYGNNGARNGQESKIIGGLYINDGSDIYIENFTVTSNYLNVLMSLDRTTDSTVKDITLLSYYDQATGNSSGTPWYNFGSGLKQLGNSNVNILNPTIMADCPVWVWWGSINIQNPNFGPAPTDAWGFEPSPGQLPPPVDGSVQDITSAMSDLASKKAAFDAVYQEYSTSYFAVTPQGYPELQPLVVSGLPSQEDIDNLPGLISSGQASIQQIYDYIAAYESWIVTVNDKIAAPVKLTNDTIAAAEAKIADMQDKQSVIQDKATRLDQISADFTWLSNNISGFTPIAGSATAPSQEDIQALASRASDAVNYSTTKINALTTARDSTPIDYNNISGNLDWLQISLWELDKVNAQYDTYIQNYNDSIGNLDENIAAIKSYLGDKAKECAESKLGCALSDIQVSDISVEAPSGVSESQDPSLNITLSTNDVTVKLTYIADQASGGAFILRSATNNTTGSDMYITAVTNVGDALGSVEFNVSDWAVNSDQAKIDFNLNDGSAKVEAKVSTTTGYMQEIQKRIEGRDESGVLISRTVDGMVYGSDGNVSEEYHKEATVIDSSGNVLEEKVQGIKYAGNQTYEETIKYDTSGNVISKDSGTDSNNTEFMQKAAVESTVTAQAADKRFASQMKITQKTPAMQQ